MAYAALVSLKQTVERHSNSSRISVVPPCQEILKILDKEVTSVQEVLKRVDRISTRYSRKKVNVLDGRIREAVHELEDVLDPHISNQFVSQSESHPLVFSLDLQEVKKDIDSFTQRVMKLKDDYIDELRNQLPEDDDDASPRTGSDGKKAKVVGLFDELGKIKDQITGLWASNVEVVSLAGMAGIGKTTIANEIYDDPHVSNCFHSRAWVRVGPKYELNDVVRRILSQVNPDLTDKILAEGDTKIARHLRKSLEGKRFLIVLDDVWEKKDDVWNKHVWDDLKRSLPDDKNGSRVLLTTRQHDVARSAGWYGFHEMRFLNKEESWDLFREKVFGDESCPHHLEKSGKKIAENCDGLPLTIVKVSEILSKAEKTPDYWNEVAEEKNSVFKDVYKQIKKVLRPSYEYLPQHLKACFLYMGVFPKKYDIPSSVLIKLWDAEGFLQPSTTETFEECVTTCLQKLVSNSVVIGQLSTMWSSILYKRIKTCRLHSAFRYLSSRKAGKNKFYHVLISQRDSLADEMEGQRRLCIQNNVLFAIKDVCKSITSISTASSLLCTGPHHLYPVPLCFGLKLLKVLNALSIRFYEFPIDVLKLIQLRYFALTYDGEIPASISNLWKLECFIVRRHQSIKSLGAPSCLPVEIWDMKELKHIQIMGSDLPDPRGTRLTNLITLSNVTANICTKGVIEGISNIKKLGIRIELVPEDVEPLSCFDHISHLNKLESLKCVVVNPRLSAPPAPLSNFPSGVKKLTLSGFGYPWEEMTKIASMPNLGVLKLQCYAFRGPKWETRVGGFLRLRFLLIEDTDLVQWKAVKSSFISIESLSIKHCYQLEELNWGFGFQLKMIELVECNPAVVTCVKQLIAAEKRGYTTPDVNVHSTCA